MNGNTETQTPEATATKKVVYEYQNPTTLEVKTVEPEKKGAKPVAELEGGFKLLAKVTRELIVRSAVQKAKRTTVADLNIPVEDFAVADDDTPHRMVTYTSDSGAVYKDRANIKGQVKQIITVNDVTYKISKIDRYSAPKPQRGNGGKRGGRKTLDIPRISKISEDGTKYQMLVFEDGSQEKATRGFPKLTNADGSKLKEIWVYAPAPKRTKKQKTSKDALSEAAKSQNRVTQLIYDTFSYVDTPEKLDLFNVVEGEQIFVGNAMFRQISQQLQTGEQVFFVKYDSESSKFVAYKDETAYKQKGQTSQFKAIWVPKELLKDGATLPENPPL